jgi:hypothetical protein
MEKHNIEDLIPDCPLLVRMNDGREYLVEKAEFISVAEYTTAILFTHEGKKRHTVVSNLNIASIETLGHRSEE